MSPFGSSCFLTVLSAPAEPQPAAHSVRTGRPWAAQCELPRPVAGAGAGAAGPRLVGAPTPQSQGLHEVGDAAAPGQKTTS